MTADELSMALAVTMHTTRCGCSQRPAHVPHLIDAIIASGVLDDIRAEAWDEGEQAGQRKNHAWNPYRAKP